VSRALAILAGVAVANAAAAPAGVAATPDSSAAYARRRPAQ
jgi:hypothetical protein